jgi:Skp family chaperone for outer membrane proteins
MLAALLLPAVSACAQTFAVVNPAKVFNEMQETKDLKQKMEADRKVLEDDEKKKAQDVEEARKARALFNEGTPEFSAKNQEFLKKALDLRVWQELTRAELGRQQKQQMKSLFEKIEAAATEVAKAKNIDLVIVEQRADFPPDLDQINVDQLRALINQRSVLYKSDKVDITNDVIAKVDANYKKPK